MLTRIVTALVCIPILVFIVIGKPLWLIMAITVLSLLGVFEFYKLTGLIKNKFLCMLGFIGSILICLGNMFDIHYTMLIIYGYMFMLFVAMLTSYREINIVDVALILFSNMYIPYFMAHINYIRSMPNYGEYFVWLVFLGAFATDTFAYFTGKLIGRHKMCPHISPKKTIEGAVGGVMGCSLTFLAFGFIVKKYFGLDVNLQLLLLLGILCAVVAELGDLVASLIKRLYDVKDFGNLFPGHGGVLDRLDSVLFVAPVVYLFLTNIGVII